MKAVVLYLILLGNSVVSASIFKTKNGSLNGSGSGSGSGSEIGSGLAKKTASTSLVTINKRENTEFRYR